MKSSKPKTDSNNVFDLYSVLSEPGVCTPDEQGRELFEAKDIRRILSNNKITVQSIWDYAHTIGVSSLDQNLINPAMKHIPRSTLINRHIDVAEVILTHHSKKIMWHYKSEIEKLENYRGRCFFDQTKADANDFENIKEYAYWLVGRIDKMRADPKKSKDTGAIESFLTDTETLLRHADEAGHMDASDALATFLYIEKEGHEEEAIALWEKSAASGYAMAIQNLSSVVMGDGHSSAEKRMHSLMSVWEGVAKNQQETTDVVQELAQAGYMPTYAMPAPV